MAVLLNIKATIEFSKEFVLDINHHPVGQYELEEPPPPEPAVACHEEPSQKYIFFSSTTKRVSCN